MRNTISLFLFISLLFTQSVLSQNAKPRAADEILNTALQTAASPQRTVFLVFHASWCSWCKRLDAVLENPALKRIIEEHYVVTRLDVLESGEKIQTLENPGGRKIMNDFGGEKSGLPFYVFLDAKGKKIADSNVMAKDGNIGYPGSAEEIAAFEKLLKKSAPRMSDEERSRIIAYLQEKAPH